MAHFMHAFENGTPLFWLSKGRWYLFLNNSHESILSGYLHSSVCTM